MIWDLKYLKHLRYHLRLEKMKLKNPDTNDHEKNVSTKLLKLETMKLKNPNTNDHERNVSTNVFKIGNNETEECRHKWSWKKCFNECAWNCVGETKYISQSKRILKPRVRKYLYNVLNIMTWQQGAGASRCGHDMCSKVRAHHHNVN